MRRRLFNVSAAVSLVLLLATVASYARTQFVLEWVEYATPQRWWRVVHRPVGIFLSTAAYPRADAGFSVGSEPARGDGFPGYRRSVSFSTGSFLSNAGMVSYVLIPYWCVALAVAPLPAMWAMAWWRRRRRGPGLCRACGYDLRASTGRCPECGTPIPPAPAEPLPAP